MTRKQIKKELNKLAKQIDKIPDHVFLDGSAEEDPKIMRLLSRYDTLRRSINNREATQ